MDGAQFAARMVAAGHIRAFTVRGRWNSVEVSSGPWSGRSLVGYGAEDWRIARTEQVRAVMFLEDHLWSACARIEPEVFALLAGEEVVRLGDPGAMAALGRLLHRGLPPAAYAEALARTHSPGRSQDLAARVLDSPADLPGEWAGRRVPAVVGPRASRSDGGTVHLTFCTLRRFVPDGWEPPTARVDQWRVTAPADEPARWETATVYEAAWP